MDRFDELLGPGSLAARPLAQPFGGRFCPGEAVDQGCAAVDGEHEVEPMDVIQAPETDGRRARVEALGGASRGGHLLHEDGHQQSTPDLEGDERGGCFRQLVQVQQALAALEE